MSKKKGKNTKQKKHNQSITLIIKGGIIALLLCVTGYVIMDAFYGAKPEPAQITKIKESLKQDKDNQPFIRQKDATDGITTYKSIKNETITVQHTTDWNGNPVTFQTKMNYPSSRKYYWLYTQPTTVYLSVLLKDTIEPLIVDVVGVQAKAYTVSTTDHAFQHLSIGQLHQSNQPLSSLNNQQPFQIPWNLYELSASPESQKRKLDLDELNNEPQMQRSIDYIVCEILWTIQLKDPTTNQIVVQNIQDMIRFQSKP